MIKLVFVDTETTGLDPDRHEIWEVAAVVFEEVRPNTGIAGRSENSSLPELPKMIWKETFSETWQLPVDESKADLIALNIGKYFDRRYPYSSLRDKLSFAHEFQKLTIGAYLVGAVPSFDEERLRKLLLSQGYCPAWNYHLVDVEALAAGKLGVNPPWNSDELADKLGLFRNKETRHTAMGDVNECIEWYKKVMEL